MKVLVVDDHPVVRLGLKQMLGGEPDIAVAGEAGSSEEAMELVRRRPWDVAILDINLPDRNGIELLGEIRRLCPELPVLMLSILPEGSVAVRSLKAGAAGYLNKDSVTEELVKAVRKVANGGKYVSPGLAERLADDLLNPRGEALHERLSDREYQVMCQLARGKTVSEIAEALNRSVNTISTHRHRILRKLGMRTNAELIHYAIQNHLLAPPLA